LGAHHLWCFSGLSWSQHCRSREQERRHVPGTEYTDILLSVAMLLAGLRSSGASRVALRFGLVVRGSNHVSDNSGRRVQAKSGQEILTKSLLKRVSGVSKVLWRQYDLRSGLSTTKFICQGSGSFFFEAACCVHRIHIHHHDSIIS
jgi:hypothetical protein